MNNIQSNQDLMCTEVVLRKSYGSYGSSKLNLMESNTYVRKSVTEVVLISRKGKCKREALLRGRASLSQSEERLAL